TLFLDEIGEMPISLQSKLLRVLQEKQIYRVGATKPINVNVRIVSATNINIKEAIHNKLFREDLYFRLSGFVLGIKRLCERKADIEPLTRIFVQKHASAFRPEICRNAIEKLTDHDWPGNVRELENVILRAMVLLEGDRLLEENIMFDDFSEHNSRGNENSYPDKNSNVFDLQNSKRRFNWQPGSELEDILDALKMHSTRDKAAAELGISPRTLRQKLYEFRKAGFSVPGAYART
ncbi:MAG: sigma 54-interacting transcriptional regulator, partial [Gammaproteobacteria bacterium]|nr:sigma 54-interacting transcriptional regulator [Gammaproteobacteria bacterium]